jgi:hypothetical protein
MSKGSGKVDLKIKGRAGLEYSCDGKTVLIDSEMLNSSEFDMVVYTGSIKKWSSPVGDQALSDEEKKRIIEDLKAELKHLRIDWQ